MAEPIGRPLGRSLTADEIDTIYRRLQPRASRVAWRITHDEAIAEDVVQEAFVRVLKNVDRFDRARPMWPWLKVIVTNIAIDHQRRRVRAEGVVAAEASLVDDVYLQSEDRRTLSQALARVPARQRAALALRYLEDWDTRDAADFFGVTPSALEQLLFRARTRLRHEYERMSDGARVVLGPVVGVGARLRRVRARTQEASIRAATPSSITGVIANFALVATIVTGVTVGVSPDSTAATSAIRLVTDRVTTTAAGEITGTSAAPPASPAAAGGSALPTLPAVATGPGGPLLPVGASGAVGRKGNEASVNGKVWTRVGERPGVVEVTPWIYCDSATRQSICDTVDRLPPTPRA
jgi:RNA polymerase sigma-70 factor (ECF subfamily)